MKHVSILVPDGECSITNIEGTYQILLRVNSWLNLILYLVEKYAGREIAITCSKGFQIDFQRDSQSPFTKAFRMIFKKVTGLSPLQYRNRYNREFV